MVEQSPYHLSEIQKQEDSDLLSKSEYLQSIDLELAVGSTPHVNRDLLIVLQKRRKIEEDVKRLVVSCDDFDFTNIKQDLDRIEVQLSGLLNGEAS
ncbi:MAG: hypothetical protein EZS28_027430 [Streblomastix strix]|uniref:Uncharacterized protein n=1 Tax=Streblomastix strix TaxID=222440 RepID=A0A5J4V3Q4_9EUKA|nr:MAG: hypothetical protein EZS28_027430 [Streblomastix strix]